MINNDQEASPWLGQKPQYVAGRADPVDLLAELRSKDELPRPEWDTLDFVLRQWTLKALSRTGDVEGLLDLHDLAGLAAQLLPREGEGAGYRVRWEAFRDLLESKRLAVNARRSGRARNLLHCQPILNLLANGPRAQGSLQEALNLSPQRLSQVLSVMEEGGLIQREKRGKEKIVERIAGPAESPATSGRAPKGAGAVIWGNAPALARTAV